MIRGQLIAPKAERLVRLPEVLERTGLSNEPTAGAVSGRRERALVDQMAVRR